MARKVFYSFHYKPDAWRASQVRNIGAVEGNQPASDNGWETIVGGGDASIKKWIDGQLNGRSCTVVLIGTSTAGREWIKYEIKQSWNAGKGLVGVYVHHLKDAAQKQSTKGINPFSDFTLDEGKTKLSSVVKAYDPPFTTSTNVYDHIKSNLEAWIEEAVTIRNNYKPS